MVRMADDVRPQGEKPVQPALGRAATGGFFWLVSKTLATKGVTVASQIVLAWLLLPQHFGLIGMTYTVSTVVNVLQQAGLREVLIQRQARFRRWSNAAFWMSLSTGLAAGLLLAAMAPIAARLYGEPELVGLILVMATATPMFALSVLPFAQLQIELRFRTVALIGLGTATGLNGLTVLFAALDFGAYSFALSWPIVLAVRLVLMYSATRPQLRWNLHFRRWRYIIGDAAVLIGARLFATTINLGGYLVLGLFYVKEIVGIYYFAFNLAMQTVLLLALNLEGVLFPTLSKLQDEPVRQREGFLTAARVLALLGIPACLLQAGLADPVMRLIFDMKRWEATIPVVQILSLGMAFRVVGWSTQSLLQAQGRFRMYLLINMIGAGVFLGLVTAGAAWATEATAAVAVAVGAAVYFAMEGPISLYVGIRPAGGRWRDVASVFIVPLLMGGLAVGLGVLAASAIPPMIGRNWLRIAVILLVTAMVYLPLSRLLLPNLWFNLMLRTKGLLRRPTS